MKNLNAFKGLNKAELCQIDGGLLAPQLGDLNTFLRPPYGDPRDWDNFLFTTLSQG